jgi:uncharacterized protein YjbJ (UPF0337 family)
MKRWRRWYGRTKAEVGQATGDRRVEAEGVAEAATGKRPSKQAVQRELDITRREHHDVEPLRAPDVER